MCKQQRIVQIRLRLLGVCSPQELGRDLQYTHKTPTTITQQDCWGTHPPVLSVLFRGSIWQPTANCHFVILWWHLPHMGHMGPWTSLPPPLSPSVSPSLSSALPHLPLPLCQCSGTFRQGKNSHTFSRRAFLRTFDLNNWWTPRTSEVPPL